MFQPDFANGTAHFLFELNADGGMNGFPRGVIQDPYGRLMVADLTNHEIKIFQVPDLGVYNVKLLDQSGAAVNTLRVGMHSPPGVQSDGAVRSPPGHAGHADVRV